jgi:diguanylate cyclase (GGDEF)-like protein/PAS domain S-box-containing protein
MQTVTHRTAQVAAITVAALAVIGVLATVSIQSAYDSNLAIERSKLSSTAQVTAELIAQQMTGVEQIERAAVQRAPVAEPAGGVRDPVQLQLLLAQITALRPEFQFAAVADAQGTTLATSPLDAAVVGQNFAFRDWYRGVLQSGQSYVSRAYVSAVAGAPLVVAIATPIYAAAATPAVDVSPGGGLAGILFIGYRVSSLQSVADRLGKLQQVDLQVTDQSGVVIADGDGATGALTNASQSPEVVAALAGRSTTVTTDQGLAAGAPVSGLGWTVSVGTPLSGTAAAGQRSTSELLAGGLLLLLAVAGGALVATTRRLERTHSKQLASAAELATVQESLTDALQVFGPDGVLVSRNSAAQRFYELRDDETTTDAVTPRWELLAEDGSPLAVEDGPLGLAMRTGVATESVVVGLRHRARGNVKWLSISTAPIRDGAARVTGFVSCARDITQRTQTIRELKVLSEASTLLSASLEPDTVIRALTSAAAELCSSPGETPRRAQLFVIDGATMTLTGEHDPAGSATFDGAAIAVAEHPYIQQVIATGLPATMTEPKYDEFGPTVADLLRRAGVRTVVWVPLTRGAHVIAVLAVAGRQHEPITSAQVDRLTTLATIGELALRNAQAHQLSAELARVDPLTGVGNRRALDDRLRHLPRTSFALVAIDVDDLKVVNDTYGHGAGDDLLSRLAHAMAAELRPADILVRTGGDEFVALLIDCDSVGAIELRKRLQRAASALRFSWGAASISVGSAAGGAGDPPAEVATAADLALYAAKRQRKDLRRRLLAASAPDASR